jgi:nucleoside-diphosphate-sugar epimerase
MKIFITGATGFIGSNLCRHFHDKNYTVHIGIRKNSDIGNVQDFVEKIYVYTDSLFDLASYLKENEIDTVIHLASCFIAEHKSEDIDKLVYGNLHFGTYLLEAMKIAGIKNLINTGTSWQHYNNETYNPVCLYAATKEAFEKIIKFYHEAEGLSCITLKLFDSYGENDTRPKLINLLNKFSSEGKILDMSEGDQEINLLHVDDISAGYVIANNILMNKEGAKINGEYALAARETITLKSLITLFNDISPTQMRVNWGLKPYRKREVMKLWNSYELLPNWQQSIFLREGLNRIFKK